MRVKPWTERKGAAIRKSLQVISQEANKILLPLPPLFLPFVLFVSFVVKLSASGDAPQRKNAGAIA